MWVTLEWEHQDVFHVGAVWQITTKAVLNAFSRKRISCHLTTQMSPATHQGLVTIIRDPQNSGTTPSSSIHVSWNYWTHNVIRNIRTHLQGCRQSRTLVFRNTGAYSNSKGLWSHSKTNSWDLFPEPVNSPQAVPFMKGGRGGFQSFWAFSRSFAALSHLPPSHEGSLLTLERNVSSASCHTAPYPLSFIATEPSATLQQNLPRRNRQETEPPLSRGPNLCCTDGEGKPSKILNERVWNMDIIGTKCLTVMVS